MNKCLQSVCLLISVAVMVTGCDFFRKVAGRPTSEEIEAKAELIAVRKADAEKARQKAVADSLEALKKHIADSVAVMDSLERSGVRIMTTSGFGGLSVAELPAKYYIIVGSFKNMDNALRFSRTVSENGYDAEVIALKNGYNAVGVCKTDDVSRLHESLKELKRQAFCPPQVWILTE